MADEEQASGGTALNRLNTPIFDDNEVSWRPVWVRFLGVPRGGMIYGIAIDGIWPAS